MNPENKDPWATYSFDLFALLEDVIPNEQVTFDEAATLVQRIKLKLDAAGMPANRQRRYVLDTLRLPTVLMTRLVFDADKPPDPTLSGEAEEAQAWETVRNWLAIFWPDETSST